MAGPDWESAAAFLASDTAFGAAPEVIETHTARVFLTPDRVWKLRRPVDYGWLDYSTRARRRAMAEREVHWNAASAPGLYLGLAGVGPGPALIGPGAQVPEDAEPLVAMRRFDQNDLFDRMAAAGRLDTALMHATGRAIAAMHRRAAAGGPPDVAALAEQEAGDLLSLADRLGREAAQALADALRARAGALGDIIATRRVRRCHGDLHLRNIVLWQGSPAPFDCIEFNEGLARIDPLYDLAFLLMDLDHRGHAELTAPVLSAWAEGMAAEPDADVATAYDGFALLALYRAFRAAIRAKIGALQAGDGAAPEEARAYLALAQSALDHAPAPRLIAVGGRSGSGKSTLARGLAGATGALMLRSDAVRKGLAGLAETERLPPESYTQEAAARVYAAMLDRAARALKGGMPVILDAAHLDPAERAAAEALASRAGVPFAGFWLEAPGATLAARTAARRGDASDATPEVVEKQLGADVGRVTWRRLDAEGDPQDVRAAALARL